MPIGDMGLNNPRPHVPRPGTTTSLPNSEAERQSKKRRKYQGGLIGLKVAASPVASNKDTNQGGSFSQGTGKSVGPEGSISGQSSSYGDGGNSPATNKRLDPAFGGGRSGGFGSTATRLKRLNPTFGQ